MKYMYVLMYGKKPIAIYKTPKQANAGLKNLELVIPKAYPVKPNIWKVPYQS